MEEKVVFVTKQLPNGSNACAVSRFFKLLVPVPLGAHATRLQPRRRN